MRGERLSAAATGVAVFLAGAVLLGLEIASSRVLAPSFGSSLYVWGALIGVVLAGLSLGYWAGGAVADREPTPSLLVGMLGLGALLVLAIPFVDGWVLGRVVDWNPGPRLNPLVATIALFGAPAVVLGTVSPVAVKLRARSLERLGRTAGRLFAVSTAGSIAGTFATAFFLIPELGTDQLLAAAAVVLLVAAAAVAAAERLLVACGLAVVLAAGGLVAVASLAPPKPGELVAASDLENWSPVYRLRSAEQRSGDPTAGQEGYRILYAKDSQYHRVAVVEDELSRFLRFDSSFQSGMFKDDPFATRFDYSDYLHLALAYHPSARRVLFIGLGGASAPKRMWRDFPELQIDTVELDPDVVDVAYRFFALPRDERLTVAVADGRRFLADHEGPWDAIIVDAFYADSIPFHLTTFEFLELARSRLAPGGVVATNIIGALSGRGSRLLRSMARTYRTAFPTVTVHPVNENGDDDPEAIRNVILVAFDGPALGEEALVERWREIRGRAPGTPDLTTAIQGRLEAPVSTKGVPVLTDDYAPTDALLLFGS